jgi:hypothetical protein
MQHTDRCVGGGSVADEVPQTHVLCTDEGHDVGALEARLTLHQIAHLFDRSWLDSRHF